MKPYSTFSTQKIIVLVAFLSAAIMTSLFLFHLRQPATTPALSGEEGMLFPLSREIKPFELVSTDHKKFTQQQFLNHWTLLFFGFTHCSTVCPNTLNVLNSAYSQLHATYPDLQVILVSLDPERDNPNTLASYVHSFNPAFIGVSGKMQAVRKLQSQLGIFSAREATSPTDNYQIQHTPSILLIDPKGKWAGLFNPGLPAKTLTQAIKKSMQALQQG